MNSPAQPNNLININEAHSQILTEQIDSLEARVREMETKLMKQAVRLHDTVAEKLENLFDENTIIEFEGLPESEGTVKVTNTETKAIGVGRSSEVCDTIKATREQLDLLNQTIEKIQLNR